MQWYWDNGRNLYQTCKKFELCTYYHHCKMIFSIVYFLLLYIKDFTYTKRVQISL